MSRKLAVSLGWIAKKVRESGASPARLAQVQQKATAKAWRAPTMRAHNKQNTLADAVALKRDSKNFVKHVPEGAVERAGRASPSFQPRTPVPVPRELAAGSGPMSKMPRKAAPSSGAVGTDVMSAAAAPSRPGVAAMNPLMAKSQKPLPVMRKRASVIGLASIQALSDEMVKIALSDAGLFTALGGVGGAALGGITGAATAPKGERLKRGLIGAGAGGAAGATLTRPSLKGANRVLNSARFKADRANAKAYDGFYDTIGDLQKSRGGYPSDELLEKTLKRRGVKYSKSPDGELDFARVDVPDPKTTENQLLAAGAAPTAAGAIGAGAAAGRIKSKKKDK